MIKPRQFFKITAPRFHIENNGKFLTRTSALTFTVSGLGQGLSVLNNKKLPKDDRKYIFCQEMATMGINLVALLTFSNEFGKWGKKLAEKGKILPHKINAEQVKQYMSEAGKKALDSKVQSKISTHIKAASVAATILGQIVALNVFAPIVRNVLAGYADKRSKQKCKNIDGIKHIASPVMPATPIKNEEQVPATMFTSTLHSTRANDMFNSFADNPNKNLQELLDQHK